MANPQDIALKRAAEAASRDQFFLGSLLSHLKTGWAHGDLARRLRCKKTQLPRLALCRTPREDAKRFRADIETIASYVRCDPAALAQVIREALAIKAFAGSSRVLPQALLAARDRLTSGEESASVDGDGNG